MKYILPLLFGMKYDESPELCPSKFNYAMEMPAEERCAVMRKYSFKCNSSSFPFCASPRVVVFQNFNPRSKYSAEVSVINLHECSQYLKVTFTHHPFFSISHEKDTIYTKLAPGMSYNVRVNFYPEDLKEHKHKIIIENEEVCCVISIIALPPKPIINFPDNILLPDTAVKNLSTLKIPVVNKSMVSGNFTIAVTPPFYVEPTRGNLAPSQTMFITFGYRSFNLGHEQGVIKVTYDFGTVLTMYIKCCSMETDVRIDKSMVCFDDTYMGLKQKVFLNIINNADHKLDVTWSMYKSLEEDMMKTETYELTLKDVRDYEKRKCADLELYNIIDYERHGIVYDRIYEDEIESSVRNAKYFYRNEIFYVIPLQDTVQAKSTKTYIFIFAPPNNAYYESYVYLDVTGRKDRIPIKLTGIGKPPSIELNLKSLNINDIFIMSQHQYEVVAFNTGAIQATLSFVDKPLEFGGEIVCIPRTVILEPLGCAVFILKFITAHQNRFIERIEYLVEESNQIISFVIRGNVICPLLKSAFHELDLGVVPIGYPIKKNINLNNESLVDIEYHTEIPDDGVQPPISLLDNLEFFDWSMPWLPKEIYFSPISYVVPGFSTVLCQIVVTPNKFGDLNKDLIIKMWGSTKNQIVIPIRANVIAPAITCNPSVINIRFCFVNYPYRRSIKLVNKSDSCGYINIHQESYKYDVDCELSVVNKFVKPNEEFEVTLDISTRLLGIRESNLILQVFGKKPTKICKIICNGQGPVITFTPSILNFGNIKLLETVAEVLRFMNDSPVVADISLTLSPNSLLSVEPKQFNLYPGIPSEVLVYAILNNPGPYTENLNVNVTSGELMYVKVQANGIGTMILVEPNILPELNLGSVMTNIPYQLSVRFTNKGKLYHKLQWSRNKNLKRLRRPNDNPDFVDSVFKINPDSFDLICNQSIDTELIALNSKSGYFEEEFYCHAMIGPSSKLQLIFELLLKARFVEPTAIFSKPEIKLRIDIGVDDTLDLLKDDIEIKNTTDLPLQFNLILNAPFYILSEDERVNEMFVQLEKDDSITVVVEFLADTSTKRCTVSQDYLKLDYIDHPKEDFVLVKGFINYPTLVIHPEKLNFGNVSLLTQVTNNVIIKNASPLPLSFRWVVIKETMEIERSQTPNISQHRLSIVPSEYFMTTSSNLNIEEEVTPIQVEDSEQHIQQSSNNLILYDTTSTLFDEDKKSKIQGVLYPIIDKYEYKDLDIQNIVYPYDFEHTHITSPDITIDITPMYGILDPYECCITSIGVQIQELIKFQLQLMCIVDGGDNEFVTVSGVASNFTYTLSDNFVNFSRRLFGDETTKTISITNRGLSPFNCIISYDKLNEFTEEEFQTNGFLTIAPTSGLVEYGKTLDINITYTAGFGKFLETIYIEVEHHEPIPITVQAFGGFNQIYLTLRRPDIYSEDTANDYNAIASLTTDDVKTTKCKSLWNYDQSKLPTKITKYERKHLMEEGYGIYFYNDLYPTIVDIELAIERQLVFNYILNELSRQKSKVYNFWRYTLPPYSLDFGAVILDTNAYASLLIMNYGPSRVAVKTVSGFALDKKGFQVIVSNSGYFGVGETMEIGVIFKPTLQMYPSKHMHVKADFKLEVKKGCTVPVNIFAEVTLPVIKLDKNCFDFGPVYCGTSLKKSIVISNPGKVTSQFYAEIVDDDVGDVAHKNYFFLKHNENKVEPNCQCRMDIYFKPSSKGACVNKLLIHIESSVDTVEVQLFGYGLVRALAVEPAVLNFTPCVPYSIGNEITFKIQNVTTTELEYCFQDLDEDRYEEEMILKFYMQCNQLNEIYIPKRLPTSRLPNYFYEFHNKLLEELRKDGERRKKFKKAIVAVKKNVTNKKRSVNANRSSHFDTPNQSKQEILEPQIGNADDHDHSAETVKQIMSSSTNRTTKDANGSNNNIGGGSSLKLAKASLSSLLAGQNSDKIRSKVDENHHNLETKMLYGVSSELHSHFPEGNISVEQIDVLANKTLKDIERLLKDLLSTNHYHKKSLFSNYSSAFVEEEDNNGEDARDKLQVGAVVVVHGAPSTNTIKSSLQISRTLKIPNATINDLILQALANEICPAAITYKQMIDTEYESIESDDVFEAWQDEYDQLETKIALLMTKRSALKSEAAKKKAGKNGKDKSADESDSLAPTTGRDSGKSEPGDKNKKKTPPKEPEIFLDVSAGIIVEILQESIKRYTAGVVIQNLETMFINKTQLLLDILLKAIGNRKYIHFIILTYDFHDYKNALVAAEINEIKVTTEKREINQTQLMETEYEDLTEEDRVFFKQLLAQRKYESQNRRMEMLKRRMEMTNETKHSKHRRKSMPSKNSPEKMHNSSKHDKEKDWKDNRQNSEIESPPTTDEKSRQARRASSKGSRLNKIEKVTSEDKQLISSLEKWTSDLLYIIHCLEYWERTKGGLVKRYVEPREQSPQTKTRPAKALKKPSSFKVSKVSIPAVGPSIERLYSILDLSTMDEKMLNSLNVGVTCWIFKNGYTYEAIEHKLQHQLEQAEELLNVIREAKLSSEPKLEELDMCYSVVEKPKTIRRANCSSLFEICEIDNEDDDEESKAEEEITENVEELDESMSFVSKASKLSRESKVSKGSKLSKGSKTPKVKITGSVTSPKRRAKKRCCSQVATESGEVFATRYTLDPGEIKLFKVYFKPKECGVYKLIYPMEIVDCHTKYDVVCNGISDIPQINTEPSMLFSRVQPEHQSVTDILTSKVFRDDFFDFGYVPYYKTRNEVNIISSQIVPLKNVSMVPCEVMFGVEGDVKEFIMNTTQTTINTGCTGEIEVSVSPKSSGLHRIRLFISIINNPKVSMINFKYTAVKIEYSVSPKTIAFELVHLNQKHEKSIKLKNLCPCLLIWKFVNYDWALHHYQFSSTYGTIAPNGKYDIKVQYVANVVETLPKRQIGLQLSSEFKNTDMFSEHVYLFAESVEMSIECEKDIDFGEVKGKTEYKFPYTLVNKGKQNLQVSFFMVPGGVNTPENEAIKVAFDIFPSSGIVIPGKPFVTNIYFYPVVTGNFKNVEVFKVNIIDSIHNDVLQNFSLRISSKVYLSRFEVCPKTEVAFGQQLASSVKTQDITLQNIGKFWFNYVILDLRIVENHKTKNNDRKGSKDKSFRDNKSVKSTKVAKESPDKSNKSEKVSKLNVGCFTIIPSSGRVEPGETATIQVQSLPQEAKHYKDSMVIFISECNDSDRKGKQIDMITECCEPVLDFDYNIMFREHFIVAQIKDFNISKNIGIYNVYAYQEKHLFMKNVCIFSTHKASVWCLNRGLVCATVTAKVINDEHGAFSVKPERVEDIATYGVFEILFNPTSMEIFTATIEIYYNNSQQGKFTFSVYGDVSIPEIKLLHPVPDDNQAVYNYPIVPIGETSSMNIKVQNTGKYPVKMIIDVRDDTNDLFSLHPHPECVSQLNIWNDKLADKMKHTNLINMGLNYIADFELVFMPQREVTTKVKVLLHIYNNPFDIITIIANAQSYSCSLITHDLPACIYKSGVEDDERELLTYKFEIGSIPINKMKIKKFSIMNITDDKVLKFEFLDNNRFKLAPRVGHLKPKSRKEIVFGFFSKVPLKIEKFLLGCELFVIRYDKPSQLLDIPWDDRQNFTIFVEEEKKSIETPKLSKVIFHKSHSAIATSSNKVDAEEDQRVEEIEKEKFDPCIVKEPPHTVLNVLNPIVFEVSLSVDYATYTCTRREIHIKDTYIMEENSETFIVKNSSPLPLKIVWDYYVQAMQLSASEDNLSTISDENNIVDTTLLNDKKNRFELVISPFVISPKKVKIQPQCDQVFTIKFLPTDNQRYYGTISADIFHLHPEYEPLNVFVYARSYKPHYYFQNISKNTSESHEICTSQAIYKKRLVEFESIGLGTIRKVINIINCSDESLHFTWKDFEEPNERALYFRCHNYTGVAAPNQKTEIWFSFIPPEFGTFKKFLYFRVNNTDKTEVFFLRGIARSPLVYFHKPSIQFEDTVLGLNLKEDVFLTNEEEMELTFKVKRQTLFSRSRDLIPTIKMDPMFGTIAAKSKQKFKVGFNPDRYGEFNYALQCHVEKMLTNLTINISGRCFEVNVSVEFRDVLGNPIHMKPTKANNVSFGNIVQNAEAERQFLIKNCGETKILYNWYSKIPLSTQLSVAFSHPEGCIEPGGEDLTTVGLQVLEKCHLGKIKLLLQVHYGPTFHFNVQATTGMPDYKLSFYSHDFGSALLQSSKSNFYSAELKIFNSGHHAINVERGELTNDNFSVPFHLGVIAPRKAQTIKIYFHPLSLGNHSAVLPITVKNQKIDINLCGCGVAMYLEPVNPTDNYLHLGVTEVGKSTTKTVRVVNKSKVEVNVLFDTWERLSINCQPPEQVAEDIVIPKPAKKVEPKKKVGESSTQLNNKLSVVSKASKISKKNDKKEKEKVKEKDNKKEKNKSAKKNDMEEEVVQSATPAESKDDTQHLLLQKYLVVNPKKPIKLLPKQTSEFVITFAPKEYMEPFSENIYCEVQDRTELFCVVKGTCKTHQYSLNKTVMYFGNVIIGSSRIKTVNLINNGQLLGKYKWTIISKENVFSIVPESGAIVAGSDVVFTISFTPKIVRCNIKAMLKCVIEGYTKPLEVKLCGESREFPQPKETLRFVCPVREECIRSVNLHNSTSLQWEVKPIIQGKFFTAENIILQGNSHEICEVTFSPLKMCTREKPHKAVVLFPMPEGQGVVYSLQGIAEDPLPAGKINREIPCKTNHKEMLPVKLWIDQDRTLSVNTKILSDVTSKTLYKVTGNKLTTVLASTTRTYTWGIYIVNEGYYEFRVIFKDEATKEYLFYDIHLLATPCTSLEDFEFVTCVRVPVRKFIKLENLVNAPVTFKIECDGQDLSFQKVVNVQPYSAFKLEVTFCPLKTYTVQTVLYAKCEELGTFPYRIYLHANAPKFEDPVEFECPLGQASTITLCVPNVFNASVSFYAKFDSPEFYTEKLPIVIEKSVQGTFDVIFEPSGLGDVNGKCTLYAQQVGEYIFPLIGKSTFPKPQGPFLIKPGSTIGINFKNPFNDAKSFQYYVSPENFVIKVTSEVIKSKKSTRINVAMLPLKIRLNNITQITGTLKIVCNEQHLGQIKWVYYLQSDL